jgi:hypothetical protein
MATPAQELVAARIAVATAKPTEYRRQCWRLAGLIRTGVLDRITAVDSLWEIPVAHALVREDRIEAIIAEAFAGTKFNPLYAFEAAA